MNRVERNTLLKLRSSLCESGLLTSEEFLTRLKEEGLIGPEAIRTIERQKTKLEKMDSVLESIVRQPTSGDGFSKLCTVLDRTGDGGRKLGRALRANLKIEKGEIEPKRLVIEQAAVYVHKKFGHSKKFSQGDKNELIRAMALKFEADRAEFQRELREMVEELANQKSELQSRDETSSAIVEALLKFHRKHESRLTTHAHGQDTTTQFLWNMAQLDARTVAGLDLLQKYFEEFFTRLDVVIYASEMFQRERELSFRFLEHDDEQGQGHGQGRGQGQVQGQQLDQALVLRQVGPDASTDAQENPDDVIKRMTSQVNTLESAVAKQRVQLETYRSKLKKADESISELKKLDKPQTVPTKAHPRAMWV